MSPRVKTLLLKIHRWLGLALGVLITVQGLTGLAVGYRDELNRLVHHDAMVVAPNTMQAPLQTIVEAARSLREGARVTRIDYPTQPDEAYLVRIEGPQPAGMMLASFDPGTGQMLRAASLAAWPVEYAYFLHYTLLNGDMGERVVGFTGLGILIMAVMGVLIWWPGLRALKAALKVKLSAGPQRALRDLHRVGGTVAALFLVLAAFTGLCLAWSPVVTPLVKAVAPTREVKVPAPLVKDCPAPAAVDDAVAAAQVRKNGEAIKSVRFPAKGQIVAVYYVSGTVHKPRATDHVWVDACTAQVLATKEAATALAGNVILDWLLPIHSGEWLGAAGRVLSVLAAAALAALGMTGYVLWFARKTKARKIAP